MSIRVEMANAQFENVNSLRSYPFSCEMPIVSRSGDVLPEDIISDVHIVAPLAGTEESSSYGSPGEGIRHDPLPAVRLSCVHLSSGMISVCFVSECEGMENALSVTVSRGDFRPYFPYRMEKLHGSSDIGGVVAFGDIDFPDYPRMFVMDSALVSPECVSAIKPASLKSFFDPRSGGSISGDVEIGFSGHVLSEERHGGFSLRLEDGSAEELASECANISGEDACGATPIRSINGIRPDGDGNIVLWFH